MAVAHGATHEKMTFLGRRFLEKGRRSGSCFDVHWSMAHYRMQTLRQLPSTSPVRLRCCSVVCAASGEGVTVVSRRAES
jgi:hypothetical protein